MTLAKQYCLKEILKHNQQSRSSGRGFVAISAKADFDYSLNQELKKDFLP
jgi:hypothetical protein